MGIRIGGRVGPVSVSTRVGARRGSPGGCLTLILLLWGLVLAWFTAGWPYYVWGWGAEVPYLIVVVAVPVVWFTVTVVKDMRYYRAHGERRPRKRDATR